MLELPPYRWPVWRRVLHDLAARALDFITRVGTVIFVLVVLLWLLASFPAPPPGATGAAIQYSLAGHLGLMLEPVLRPIGFNWQIAVALVPGLASREVVVGALGTVYALSAVGASTPLGQVIAQSWSLATALSLLAWFVFSPQCVSTLAAVLRETASWRYTVWMVLYQFALAYAAAFVTYRCTLWLTG